MYIRYIFCLVVTFFFFISANSIGQVSDTTVSQDRKAYIRLVRDSYNGFYALGAGTFSLTPKVDLSIFAIMRSLQVGIGPTFKLNKSKILLSPLLGMTYGKKFSGNDHPVIGDAIVPSILFSRKTKSSYMELFAFWYLPARGVKNKEAEYLWLWSNSGIRLSKTINLGLHFETLQLLKSAEKSSSSLYLWLGPNVQINFTENAQFRLSAGKDFNAYEFMKIDFTFFVD